MILPAISNNIKHIGMKKYWYLQVLGHFPCIFESEIDRIDIFRYKMRGGRPKIDVLKKIIYTNVLIAVTYQHLGGVIGGRSIFTLI